MKVIFLDIDGVMNSEIFYRERHKKRWLTFKFYRNKIRKWYRFISGGFQYRPVSINYRPDIYSRFGTYAYGLKRLNSETDPNKWRWLAYFCNKYGYKICISSVWKDHFKPSSLWELVLQSYGFKPGTFIGITKNHRTLRGSEIKEFLDEHPEITEYAIVDDDSDMLPSQKVKNFFHIDSYYGLSPNHLYRVGRLFNKD